jgi:hypothetical protein
MSWITVPIGGGVRFGTRVGSGFILAMLLISLFLGVIYLAILGLVVLGLMTIKWIIAMQGRRPFAAWGWFLLLTMGQAILSVVVAIFVILPPPSVVEKIHAQNRAKLEHTAPLGRGSDVH